MQTIIIYTSYVLQCVPAQVASGRLQHSLPRCSSAPVNAKHSRLRARFLATPSTPVLPPPAAAYGAPSPHDEWEPDEEQGAGDGWDLDDLEWPAENEELRDASVGNAAPTMPTMLPPTLPLGRSGGIGGGRGGGSKVRYMQGGAR